MADVPELHLVPNCSGIWSYLVDKKGCGGAIWTNLDVHRLSSGMITSKAARWMNTWPTKWKRGRF
ncbi:hypothetical protein T08_8480 [Trichinella sp. T8]|nr:hypothetical protein T08_8480 [Trichinella sp. T8]